MHIAKQKLMTKSQLRRFVDVQKEMGKRIVLTSGSWDILHVGHMRYLENARNQGDILVVGADSDSKIRKRKGKDRPIVSETERMEMIAHLNCVDAVYLKPPRQESNGLIKLVRPDILIVSKTTNHSKEQHKVKEKLCGEIKVLPAQAKTSTTGRIRLLHIDGQKRLADKMIKEIPDFLEKILGDK